MLPRRGGMSRKKFAPRASAQRRVQTHLASSIHGGASFHVYVPSSCAPIGSAASCISAGATAHLRTGRPATARGCAAGARPSRPGGLARAANRSGHGFEFFDTARVRVHMTFARRCADGRLCAVFIFPPPARAAVPNCSARQRSFRPIRGGRERTGRAVTRRRWRTARTGTHADGWPTKFRYAVSAPKYWIGRREGSRSCCAARAKKRATPCRAAGVTSYFK